MRLSILFIISLFLMTSYSVETSAQNETSIESEMQAAISKHIERLKKSYTLSLRGQRVVRSSTIINLYELADHLPIWDLRNQADLMDILEASYYEGLNPEDYHLDFIRDHHIKMSRGEKMSNRKRAKADIIMTDAALRYALHIIQGKVDPTVIDSKWNYRHRALPDSVEYQLLSRLGTYTLKEGDDALKPQTAMYANLKYWFSKYDALVQSGSDSLSLSYPGMPLRKGDTLGEVAQLREALRAYLDPVALNAGIDPWIFDKTLEDAVISFQNAHGLDADGIAGKKTFSLLSQSNKEKLDILRVNLERARWLSGGWPADFILVNISEFMLYVMKDGALDYSCKVQVGKTYHKTPVFADEMEYVEFNPTWSVPYSIASKELLPKIKKDPYYLSRNDMSLLSNGNKVDPSLVNFNNYSSRNFPYSIRQGPGPKNALGQVKFIFPNQYSVYLHDTPSKSKFNESSRAFSHGCIRVHEPLKLAEVLLRAQGVDESEIERIITSKKTKRIHLDEKLVVMIMYWTAYEEDGKLYFFEDIYERDKKVLKELKKKSN